MRAMGSHDTRLLRAHDGVLHHKLVAQVTKETGLQRARQIVMAHHLVTQARGFDLPDDDAPAGRSRGAGLERHPVDTDACLAMPDPNASDMDRNAAGVGMAQHRQRPGLSAEVHAIGQHTPPAAIQQPTYLTCRKPRKTPLRETRLALGEAGLAVAPGGDEQLVCRIFQMYLREAASVSYAGLLGRSKKSEKPRSVGPGCGDPRQGLWRFMLAKSA